MITLSLMSKIYKDKKFMSVASPILTHKEFIKTKSIVHHGDTRFNHSLRVSYLAYKIANILGCDTTSTIRAGALHDFFLVRDDKNIMSSTKMFINHPMMAKENAITFFGVNEKEQNIIESHMFPMSPIAPKSKEAWIVTFSDKVVALFEGSKRMQAQVSMWMLLLINFIK